MNDRLSVLREKMVLWIEQGVELAWLIDPERKVVEMYRPGRGAEVVKGASGVYADGPVSGFVLEPARIWA